MQRGLVQDDRGGGRGSGKRGGGGGSWEGGSREGAGGKRKVEKVQEQKVQVAGPHLRQLDCKKHFLIFF